MLGGLGGAAEPGVVGHVDQQVRLELGQPAAEGGDDVLVADQRADTPVAELEGRQLGAAVEVRRRGEPLLERGDLLVKGDVLAEDEQVVLVEAAGDPAVGLHHEGRVVGVLLLAAVGQAAEEQRLGQAVHHAIGVPCRPVARHGALEVKRVGRLGPDQQLGALALQIPAHLLVQLQVQRRELPAPLLHDAHVGLDHAHLDLGGGRPAGVDLVDPDPAVDQRRRQHRHADGR